VYDSCCAIPPVGSRSPEGDGLWGQADLGGSMWEWNLDWHASYPMQCNDCSNLESASYRVDRGGSWCYNADNLRAASRHYSTPTSCARHIGARCARTP